MCGIFGWQLNGVPQRQRRRIAELLAWDMDRRGGHSWGIYCPRTNQVSKGLGKICQSVGGRELARLDCFFAHTRFATSGPITRANAHPFRIGGIVGAHNGMVSNHDRLNRSYGRACAVDSMHLFHHLADQEALCEIEGYGTVEYVRDDQRQRVFLATFDGEICVAQSEFGVIWASTVDAVYDAVEFARIGDWDEVRLEHRKLYFVQGGKIYDAGAAFEVSPFVSPLQSFEHTSVTSGGCIHDDSVDEAREEVGWWNDLADEELEVAWHQWN